LLQLLFFAALISNKAITMRFEDLEFPLPADLIPYQAQFYIEVRTAITQHVKEDLRDNAIHYTYCMQNFHLNFSTELKNMVKYFNDHAGKLPHGYYFEPASNSFPPLKDEQGNRISKDGLRVFNKVYLHHVNDYKMKDLPKTWNTFIKQYQRSFRYALKTQQLNEWLIRGGDACFEGITENMDEWFVAQERREQIAHKAIVVENVNEAIQVGMDRSVKQHANAEDFLADIMQLVTMKEEQPFPVYKALLLLSEFGFAIKDPATKARISQMQDQQRMRAKEIIKYFKLVTSIITSPAAPPLKLADESQALLKIIIEEPKESHVIIRLNLAVEKHVAIAGEIAGSADALAKPTKACTAKLTDLYDILQALPFKPKELEPVFFEHYIHCMLPFKQRVLEMFEKLPAGELESFCGNFNQVLVLCRRENQALHKGSLPLDPAKAEVGKAVKP
jgi:hypothetical protein